MSDMSSSRPGFALAIAVTAAAALALSASTSFAADSASRFDLPAESLDKALRDFAIQIHCQISYEPALVAGLQAPEIRGEYTPSAVLSILLKGTKLRAVNVTEDMIQVVETSATTTRVMTPDSESESAYGAKSMRVAYAGPVEATSTATEATQEETKQNSNAKAVPVDREHSKKAIATEPEPDSLAEVVVTGTHIRGLTDSPSRVQIYDRSQIDRMGAGSVADFMKLLPENLGSISEGTISGVANLGLASTSNAVNGAAVNLRGLGADATLILMNGRRIAPGSYLGDFTDVSLIPLAAVDHIEVSPDGASAIYGADAVGGVVNFIMRKDFDGAETRARFGTVAHGDRHEITVGQTVGHQWSSGSALASYEYADSTPLSAADRSYSSTALQPFNLLPEQIRHGGLVTLDQRLADTVAIFFDGTFAHRSTYTDTATVSYIHHDPADINAYSATAGSRVALPNDAQLEVSAGYANNRTRLDSLNMPAGRKTFSAKSDSVVSEVDAKVDGPLWSMPAGAIKYAVGGQYRNESYDYKNLLTAAINHPGRHVSAAFAELHIPIIAANSERVAEERLSLNLAGRYEHYSDFGSSTNPQLGLLWRATRGLKVRGTYGTSFEAPLLKDLNPAITQAYAVPNADPRGGGSQPCYPPTSINNCTNVLFVLGGNAGLQPQKATTWTVGLDVEPEATPYLRASIGYYHIDFRDRITVPVSQVPTLGALRLESTLGSKIVQRNPSPALIQSYAANPVFINPFNIDLATIGALIDLRVQNLSRVTTNGLDLHTSSVVGLPFGKLDVGVDATYILKFTNQFSSASPTVDYLNTPYNPVNLKARGHASMMLGPFSFSAFLNFTNSYDDNRTATPLHVASWTTADATLAYESGARGGALKNSSLYLSIVNIADRAPPYVANPHFPVYFDGVNANTLGRYYSVLFAKQF